MSLQNEIDKWSKSAAGKKKIEEARKRAIRDNRPFGISEHGTGLQSSEFYAMEM